MATTVRVFQVMKLLKKQLYEVTEDDSALTAKNVAET